jgi:D-3-phosphoglycerate dehydrogenase
MRPGAVLVNTARGGVVDEDALVAAIRSGPLSGAAVDVFEPEPPPLDHPLYGLSNVIVTPHIAGLTDEAMRRLSEAIANGVLSALRGERPPHVVDPAAWPPRRCLSTI